MSEERVLQYISPGSWALAEPLFSDRGKKLLVTLIDFLEDHVLPAEDIYHAQIPTDPAKRWTVNPPIMEDLKNRAKKLGLWNLWLSGGEFQGMAGGSGGGLSNLEYAVMAQIMGYSLPCSLATNCAAPDTGNMEVFARFGTPEQKKKYLAPLLDGKIRSSFSMTEVGTASSDATNLHNTTAVRSGSSLILNGHKWWISGAGDPSNAVHIVLAVTDPDNPSPYKRYSLVLVEPKASGVKLVRPMTVLGFDDAPEGHFEVKYENVKIDGDRDVVGGKAGLGRGFEMIQARLGPGRLHHCMRSIGVASRALDLMLHRVSDPVRKTFGRELREHGTIVADIAKSRSQLDSASLLVLSAARAIDRKGAKGALKEIGIAKFTVPSIALEIVDRSMQAHGGEGLSQDQPLAYLFAHLRTLRYADGPDEVHIQQVGKAELKRVEMLRARTRGVQSRRAQLVQQHGIRAKL